MNDEPAVADELPADLAARLWAIEHVVEAAVIWYWRMRSDHFESDWRPIARDDVEHARHAGLTWAVDQGLEPGRNPEMEALVAKHVARLYEHAYRRLDMGLRRVGGDDP